MRTLVLMLTALVLAQGLGASGSTPSTVSTGSPDMAGALQMQRRLVSVFENNRKGVVKVISAFQNEDEETRNVLLVGTGFYISREGHILTNTNVVFGADRIWVERDGIAYVCEAIGHDPLTNISIIRALTLPADYEFLRFTDKPELPAIGSFIMAISCQLGMDPGPSLGLVTGWNTQYVERILPTVYLRSDIPYDGGEGGSPVFDLNGALVGMIVASLPEIRSSFILPARAIQRIRDDILFSGEVTYAYFGFQTRQTASLASGPWVEVQDIQPGSPSDLAGIQRGDILKQLGDFKIKTDDDLRTASFFTRPNEYVNVTVIRGDHELNLEMRPTVREVPITAMPPVKPQPPTAHQAPLPVGTGLDGIPASTDQSIENGQETEGDRVEP